MIVLRRSRRAPFGPRADRALTTAAVEATRLGHDYVGTEHLLVALARDETTGPVLESLGVAADDVREEIERRVGRCANGRAQPNADALAAIGIDLDEVRRRIEETFGEGALERAQARGRLLRRTPRLEKALDFARRDAGCDATAVAPKHLLLGLASCEGIAAEILAANGISPFDIVAVARSS